MAHAPTPLAKPGWEEAERLVDEVLNAIYGLDDATALRAIGLLRVDLDAVRHEIETTFSN